MNSIYIKLLFIIVVIISFFATHCSDKSNLALPPQSLICDNIKSTDVTVRVKVQEVKLHKEFPSDDKKSALAEYLYRGKVLKVYKGDLHRGDHIEFYSNLYEIPPAPDKKLKRKEIIASLSYGNSGQMGLLDKAYDFEYSKQLNVLFEQCLNTISE